MAVITGLKSDWLDLYDGFDAKEVGIGLTTPNIYASAQYAKKKTGKVIMGGVTDIIYTGFEHDHNPLIMAMGYEPQYNTLMALNLHYVPENHRRAIIKWILMSNMTRLKSNNPILIDYHRLKKAIPSVEGIVRRYKLVGIRVVGAVPIKDWPRAIKQPSPWQNMYKEYMR